MPGLIETDDATPSHVFRDFSIAHQKLELDLNFHQCSISGKSIITAVPDSKELRVLRFNVRQAKITRIAVNDVDLSKSEWTYADPYVNYKLHTRSSVYQHHVMRQKLELSQPLPHSRDRDSGHPAPASLANEEELVIRLPNRIQVREMNLNAPLTNGHNSSSEAHLVTDSIQTLADGSVIKYEPLRIRIEYLLRDVRDGFHFVEAGQNLKKFPCLFSITGPQPGFAASAFPCIDSINERCLWDISIRCPTTLANAVKPKTALQDLQSLGISDYGVKILGIDRDDREMIVLCSGDPTGETVDRQDPSRKTVSFSCTSPLSAQQIGLVVGPFERVNLAELQDNQQEDEANQGAVEMYGYCLPGRVEELRNTCLPVPRAFDHIIKKYGSSPFRSFSLCFVEELQSEVTFFASLSICSAHLLYPEDIIDPAEDVTRKLVHSIASQWIGINVVPKEPSDTWVIVGIAHFITDLFMKELSGLNEYKFRLKRQSDRVCELDHSRPSLSRMGTILHIDPSELEFMALKAPLVLYILDRRITKTTGMPRMPSIISRIFLRTTTGEIVKGELSTDYFQKICEKFYHAKIDDFLNQWVRGAGCPSFRATQRFNKKKIVVEMLIQQTQGDISLSRDLEPDHFLRDVKEEFQEVDADPVQNVFTGPMTIRIHEADGTPYEHIVDIKEATTKFEIPYNTKYKRLKRTKRQRERERNEAGLEASEAQEDALVYCLGDVLHSEEEIRDWRIQEWSPEQESEMSQEHYEWMRLDVDFEWIATLQFSMPGYMFVSQLQQDRDVVAQLEAIQHMDSYPAHPLLSSIMVRTLMDRRYFHGIRTAAAKSLIKHAKQEVSYIGLFHLRKAFEELFCLPPPNNRMPRPNDFSNRATYNVQCAILRAVAQVRNNEGEAPLDAKTFLFDKLNLNDNSINEYSDCYYVALLLRSITDALTARREVPVDDAAMDFERSEEEELEKSCLTAIDRVRRVDEWSSSYQNLSTRAALDCQRRLSRAQMAPIDAVHLLQYTRCGNYDQLRVNAFQNVLRCDIFKSSELLTWFLCSASQDPSPWVRDRLRQSFANTLARVSMGLDKKPEVPVQGDALVIEQEVSTEAMRSDQARKKTISGATEALKKELGSHSALAELLWAAVNSSRLRLNEVQDFLDICKLLYDEHDDGMVVLKRPRFWRARHIGKGLLLFSQTDKIRPLPSRPIVTRPAPVISNAKPVLPKEFSLPTPLQPAVPDSMPPPLTVNGEGTRKILKVKIRNPSTGNIEGM
ncbi:MAG: hypothetical protein Q9227_002381 [Pyrenula ochraceoflavens]